MDVLIFGSARLMVGSDRVRVSVVNQATAADVLRALKDQHSALGPALGAARLAINHAFAGPETVVRDTDEVALIALVGGG